MRGPDPGSAAAERPRPEQMGPDPGLPGLVTAGSLASPRVGQVRRTPAAQAGGRSTKVPAIRGHPGPPTPAGVRTPRAAAKRL